jgi:glyoxylase-like metal-dependent hydrolase (beta-lactamase superfamily II)
LPPFARFSPALASAAASGCDCVPPVRRHHRWLIGLLPAVALLFYWLLVDNRPGAAPARTLDITRMRALAERVPGAKPRTIEIQLVGWRRVPATAIIAGGGLKSVRIGVYAARLRGPWGDIAIDSGVGAAEAGRMKLDRFEPRRQDRVDAALRTSRLIVFTHEHPDHLSGLLRLPDFASVAARALITPEQGPRGPLADDLTWPAGSGRWVRPFRYTGMAAVAPGVVLVRTPGHTLGSQMVFVRLADGREVLFTGDTATLARSWQELRARPRMLSDFAVPEDRAAVFGWLKGLRALKAQVPRLILIPGHDIDDLAESAPPDLVRFGFAVSPK